MSDIDNEYIWVVDAASTAEPEIGLRIHKSALIAESSFFRAMFRNPCKVCSFYTLDKHDKLTAVRKETESGVVYLHDESSYVQSTIFGMLGALPHAPLWLIVDCNYHHEFLPKIESRELTNERVWLGLVGLVERFVLADKYDIPALRRLYAEHYIPHFLARYQDPQSWWYCELTMAEFLTEFFQHVCDRLGYFPEDFFEIYSKALLYYMAIDEDVTPLLDAADKHPKLSSHLNRVLVREMTSEAKKTRLLERDAKRKTYQLNVTRRCYAKLRVTPLMLNTEPSEQDFKVIFDYGDEEEYTDMED